MTKKELNETLKDLGLGLVKSQVDHYHNKTFKGWDGTTYKGFKGSGIGPMTLTNAHDECDARLIEFIRTRLYHMTSNFKSYGTDAFEFTVPTDKADIKMKFVRQYFPTYAHNTYDPGYKTAWYVLSK